VTGIWRGKRKPVYIKQWFMDVFGIRNAKVVGSTPISGTTPMHEKPALCGLFLYAPAALSLLSIYILCAAGLAGPGWP